MTSGIKRSVCDSGLASASVIAAASLASLTLGCGHVQAADPSAALPNIVILISDDLGYRDIGCYGGPVNTPALDRLAAAGAKFTDFYTGCAVCSPSRATLLTGRQHIRTGVYSWINDGYHRMHLLDREVTIAEVLKDAGYATAHMGKWHLWLDDTNPGLQGFDYWLATDNNASPSHKNPVNFVRNGKRVGVIEGYSCQIVVDEAIQWLDDTRREAQPFFLNLWFHEPHDPLAAPPEMVDAYRTPDEQGKKLSPKSKAIYHGTIENTDQAVARLLDKMDALGVSKNTLIIYASDNGSRYRGNVNGSNGELKDGKGSLWEGGIRSPGIFYWPGRIKPGTEIREPAGLVDLLPSICAIVGREPPHDRHIDGSDISPLLFGQPDAFSRHQPLFWCYPNARPIVAMRDGRYSLVADPSKPINTANRFEEQLIPELKSMGLSNYRLYDLVVDPGQEHDLAAKNPELLESLKSRLAEITESVMADGPDWHLQ